MDLIANEPREAKKTTMQKKMIMGKMVGSTRGSRTWLKLE
jgi:hypothetical protein